MDSERLGEVSFMFDELSEKYGCFLFHFDDDEKKLYLFLDKKKNNYDSSVNKYENIKIIINRRYSEKNFEVEGAVIDLELFDKKEMENAHNFFLKELENGKEINEIFSLLKKQFDEKFPKTFEKYNEDYANLLYLFHCNKNDDSIPKFENWPFIYVGWETANGLKQINCEYKNLKLRTTKSVFFPIRDINGLDIIELADELLLNNNIQEKKNLILFIEGIKKQYLNKGSLPKYSIENTLKDITIELNNVLNNININDDKIKSANFIIQLD